MNFEDEGYSGSLDLVLAAADEGRKAEDAAAERAEQSRRLVDEARYAMAELAAPAVGLVALRLAGVDRDWDGRPVTDERIDTAWSVLDRVGIPKLRATAIAASIAQAPRQAAPGSPGWDPRSVGGGEEEGELGVGEVDAQITAFLEGARAARDLGRDQ